MKNYKNRKNINNKDEYLLSSDKEINKNDQNYYLNKFRKMYGNSFNDFELLDIFAKNNYNEKQIMEDIKAILTIGTNKKYDNYNSYNNYNSYDRKHNSHKSSSKSRGKKNKYEKRPFQIGIEIPSDYAPPPKKEEEEDNININEQNNGNKNEKEENKNIDKANNNKNEVFIKDNNTNENNNYKNDLLLTYKENLFKKLKNPDYSYKSNKSKNDEINAENILNNRNEYPNYQKKINLTEKNRNIKIENNSPGPQCQPYKKTKINQNINKDLKKKYIRTFFGNMKNYSNNIRRENWEKSPDLNRRDNILDTSPDKMDLYERRVLTYKKGYKNYYSNDNEFNFNKKKEYKYLKIEKNVNDFSIFSCYDNPQRNQYLKIINEKRRQNPDKIIEFLIPQFPPMFPPMQQFQNIYNPYNQYNPYMNMNMYMMSPPPQFPMQNPNPIIANIPAQNINNNSIGIDKMSNNSNSNNHIENNETPENQNILTPTQIMQINNNNQMNVKINNTPNPNALLINNNDMNNSKSNKSSGNVGNSGNNVIDENIHL